MTSFFDFWYNEHVHVAHKTHNRAQIKPLIQGCNSYPRQNKSSGPLAFLNSRHLPFSLIAYMTAQKYILMVAEH